MQVEIPEGWQQLHWKQQVALATQLSGSEVGSAAQAKAIIGKERKRRSSGAVPAKEMPDPNKFAPVESTEGEPEVPLRLLRDAWRGEERVRANGDVSKWPLSRARQLIEAGVAERTDPLPGE